jgi:hypothetical protein
VNIENALSFTIPPGTTRKATMTVERGPIAYDYDNLEIVLASKCDDNISDRKKFNVRKVEGRWRVVCVKCVEGESEPGRPGRPGRAKPK